MRHLYDDEVVIINCHACNRCSKSRKRVLNGVTARVVREHPHLPSSYELSLPNDVTAGSVVCPGKNLEPELGEDYTEEKKKEAPMPEAAPVGAMTQPESPKFDNYGYGPACGDPSCRAMQNEDHVKTCARTGTFRLDE